ncbi:DUF6059 family protein [Streptomyces sp. NPDC048349]|uniref:DUF6059 family protein n=1 Tax=Streptomyces sp. NPDC048349 TaxID=3155486 RepID=UPI00342D021D
MRPGRRPSLARRWAGVVWQGLISFGTLHMHGETLRAEAEPRPVPLGGPPPGHPERLCPELPLSPVERALFRDLQARGPVH